MVSVFACFYGDRQKYMERVIWALILVNVNLVNESIWKGPKTHCPPASQIGPPFQLNMVVVYLRAELVYKTILRVQCKH